MLWRAGFFPLIALALAGCLSLARKTEEMPWPSGPNAVSLLAGTVVLDAPDGYCVEAEEASGTEVAQSIFFAACGPGYPHVVMSAVVSPQITPGILDEEGTATLASYFATDRGRQTLARTGRVDDVTVHQTEVGEGVLVLHLTDKGASPKAGLAEDYWRAVAEVNGHLVTFAVLPFTDATMPDETLRALLADFVETSRAASSPLDAAGGEVPT